MDDNSYILLSLMNEKKEFKQREIIASINALYPDYEARTIMKIWGEFQRKKYIEIPPGGMSIQSAWIITQTGIAAFNNERSARTEQGSEQQLEKKDKETKRTLNSLTLADYKKVQYRANVAIWISAISTLIAILAVILSLLRARC